MGTLREKEMITRVKTRPRPTMPGPITLLKATQFVYLGFLCGAYSQNFCLIQTWVIFTPVNVGRRLGR